VIFFRKARIKSIIKNLTEPNLRADDIEFLVQNGELAVESLITALIYGNESVSKAAMGILVQVGEPAVEPLITELLYDDDDENLPQSIIEILVQIGEPAVKPLIAQAYKSRLIHQPAIEVWGRIGEPATNPLVAELHNSNVQEIRELAMKALQKIEYIAVEPFIVALKDSSVYIRQAAVKELGRIGDAQTVELLLTTALKDENLDVRQAAVEAVEQMGSSQAREARLALQLERKQLEREYEPSALSTLHPEDKGGPADTKTIKCPRCGASNTSGMKCWMCHHSLSKIEIPERERGGCLSLWLVAVMGLNLIGGFLAIEVLGVFLLTEI
jgi:HEAT repeat protein